MTATQTADAADATDTADRADRADRAEAGAPTSFGAELFRGRLRPDLLALPAGDPRVLTAEDERFLARLREFCAAEVDGALIEREDRIPGRVIEGLKDIGALSVRIPREYGGLGLSGLCYLRALMIVTTAHSAIGELLAAHQSIGLPQPLLLFGTDEQKRRFLPRCVREISAFTLTEADIGNDPFRMHTTAVADDDAGTYLLNGVKLWATNGVLADLLVVMAHVPASDRGPGGMTAFVVEGDAEGLTVEHRSSFLGLRGLENGVVRLHDVVVPVSDRIGGEGEGLGIALAAQATGRLSMPAVCAAAAKWSLRIAREWSGVRVQWGRPIGEHDAVAGKLAFIAATAFALEAMVEVSGRRADAGGQDTGLEAELAKLFASEQAWLVADELVQLRGGRGYETAASAAARGERGVPAEQLLRDLRIGRIFDGSTEALRSFLAQAVLDQHRGDDPSPVAHQEAGVPSSPDVPSLQRDVPSSPEDTLAVHLSFAERAAREVAELMAAEATRPDTELEYRQRYLGRIVDIGAELYAMSASCAYASALDGLGDSPRELADAFCRQASRRVARLVGELSQNTDAPDRTAARQVLAGRHGWLEEGVLDPADDGPWIAEPEPGPATVPNLRRAVPGAAQPSAHSPARRRETEGAPDGR